MKRNEVIPEPPQHPETRLNAPLLIKSINVVREGEKENLPKEKDEEKTPPALPEIEALATANELTLQGKKADFVAREQGHLIGISRRKKEFLDALRKFFPNIQRACIFSGLTRPEFKKQFADDEEFRSEIQAITTENIDNLEQYGFERAFTDKGFGYWQTLLKAYRPEKFDPKRALAGVDARKIDDAHERARSVRLAEIVAIDAEVIEAVTGKPAPVIPTEAALEATPIDDIIPNGVTPERVAPPPEYPSYSGPTDRAFEDIDKASAYAEDYELPAGKEVRPKNPTGGPVLSDPPPLPPPPKKQRKK